MSEKKKEEILGPALNVDDKAVAFAGPAVFANRFFATVTQSGMRLAFTELVEQGQPPQFRNAVFMSYGDAAALAELINKMMEQYVQSVPVDQTQPIKPDGDQN